MVFFERIDVAEVDAENIVTQSGTQGDELTAAVVGRLVEIAGPDGKQPVVSVLGSYAEHKLFYERYLHDTGAVIAGQSVP
jgi:hypothetical protein